MKVNKLMLVNAAVVGLLASGSAGLFSTNAQAEGVKCDGGNACKAKGECGGKGNSCAGHNACKGKGWTMAASEADCTKAGGKVEAKASAGDKAPAAPAAPTKK